MIKDYEREKYENDYFLPFIIGCDSYDINFQPTVNLLFKRLNYWEVMNLLIILLKKKLREKIYHFIAN